MVSQQRIYYSNFLSTCQKCFLFTLLLVGEQLSDYYSNLCFNIAFRLVASSKTALLSLHLVLIFTIDRLFAVVKLIIVLRKCDRSIIC